MHFQLILLVSSISVAACVPYLTHMPKIITVTEENQHELGLPIGTKLKKDKRTQRYIPPPLSDDFDAEARLALMFTNKKKTAYNHCRVGPKIEDRRFRDFAWSTFCRDADGENLCCHKKECSCNLVSFNCACLSKEDEDYWDRKKQQDFDHVIQGINTGVGIASAAGQLGKGK